MELAFVFLVAASFLVGVGLGLLLSRVVTSDWLVRFGVVPLLKTHPFFTFRMAVRPSFLEGAARILDFGNVLATYNTSPLTDIDALTADALAVAVDMQYATARVLLRSAATPRPSRVRLRPAGAEF